MAQSIIIDETGKVIPNRRFRSELPSTTKNWNLYLIDVVTRLNYLLISAAPQQFHGIRRC
jgi:hypothetical protein